MSEEEPETEDWLGKNIEDGIGDDLSIKTNKTTTVSDTPDAKIEVSMRTSENLTVAYIG